MPVNEFGQPVGEPVDWSPGVALGPVTLTGRACSLEPLGERHVDGLYAALCVGSPPSTWTYLSVGPFGDRDSFAGHLAELASRSATVPLAIVLPGRTTGGYRDLAADRPRPGHGRGRQHHLRRGAAAHRRRHRGDVPDGARTRSTSRGCVATSGSATTSTSRRVAPPSGWASPTRAPSARPSSTRAATATPRGTPSPTRSGRALRRRFETWLDPGNFDEDGRQVRRLEDC